MTASNTWSYLFTWYNLPFTLFMCTCLLLAALQLFGLGGDQESELHTDLAQDVDLDHDLDFDHDLDVYTDIDLDHDLDIDHDVDFDHNLDVHTDLDLDHDLDMDHDFEIQPALTLGHEVDADGVGGLQSGSLAADHSGDSLISVLAFIGVGKIPLMVVLMLFFSAAGLFGWSLNGAVRAVFNGYPGPAFLLVLPFSMIGASLVSSRAARWIGQLLPPVSSTATRSQALVGRIGTVISPYVDERYGMVHVRDAGGTLISVFAINPFSEAVRRGDRVILVAYDLPKRLYTIRLAQVSEPD